MSGASLPRTSPADRSVLLVGAAVGLVAAALLPSVGLVATARLPAVLSGLAAVRAAVRAAARAAATHAPARS